MKYLFLFISTLCILGCNDISVNGYQSKVLHPALASKGGLVYKYYKETKYPRKDHFTSFYFEKYEQDEGDLVITKYLPSGEISSKKVVSIEDNRWRLTQMSQYNYGKLDDKLFEVEDYDVRADVLYDFTGEAAKLETMFMTDDYQVHYTRIQEDVKDTLIGNDQVIMIGSQGSIEYAVKDNDTIQQEEIVTTFFQPDLGIVKSTTVGEGYEQIVTLDRVMTVEAFEKEIDHGLTRVAYIDKDNVLDDANQFSPCYHQSKIYDYYNDDDARMIGGKGAMRDLLDEYYNHTSYPHESGYFTFRFVVNCEGKAGWFTTEEATLNYETKSFPDTMRSTFLTMLQSVEEWYSLKYKSEAVDAYVYITFKIKDGKIIEILPQ